MSEFDVLFAAAKATRANAHAPYSDFPVGAAILTASGSVHAGCNVENASFPEGWCAETTALGRMVALEGDKAEIKAILVMADAALCTPCGGCRQRLAEFADDATPVHVCDTNGLRRTFTLGELLPHKFVLK